MDNWQLRLYFRELARQCKFAFAAYEGIKHELQVMLENEDRSFQMLQEFKRQAMLDDNLPDFAALEPLNTAILLATDHIFCYIQAFLVATGNVSKLLWLSQSIKKVNRARADIRAAELRQALQVPDNPNDSPLGSRDIRNKYEHFDEVLDEVVATNASIADTCINIIGHVIGGPLTYLRNFDSETFVVTFMGLEPLPLIPLVQELERLAILATDLEHNGRGPWWPDITIEKVLKTAKALLRETFRNNRLPTSVDDWEAALSSYQAILNEELHHELDLLPKDVQIVLRWSFPAQLWMSPINLKIIRNGERIRSDMLDVAEILQLTHS